MNLRTWATAALTPILPRSKLYLTPTGQGDDARFAGIFRKTWQRLPPAASSLLLEYWREHGRESFPEGPIPRIQLLNGWTDRESVPQGVIPPFMSFNASATKERYVKRMGAFRMDGHELIFHSALVDRMPEQEVAGLIGHELGHVVLLAEGDMSDGELGEYRADELAHAWGYEPADLDIWHHQHVRRWNNGAIQWREKPLPRGLAALCFKVFVPGNHNGRYRTSRNIPIRGKVAA